MSSVKVYSVVDHCDLGQDNSIRLSSFFPFPGAQITGEIFEDVGGVLPYCKILNNNTFLLVVN